MFKEDLYRSVSRIGLPGRNLDFINDICYLRILLTYLCVHFSTNFSHHFFAFFDTGSSVSKSAFSDELVLALVHNFLLFGFPPNHLKLCSKDSRDRNQNLDLKHLNYLIKKIFWAQNTFLGQKYFWCENTFRVKNIFGAKNTFDPKIISGVKKT